ncbi:hypothetical protein V8C35DRAFT_172664 [Trichoderma chlorosporum]
MDIEKLGRKRDRLKLSYWIKRSGSSSRQRPSNSTPPIHTHPTPPSPTSRRISPSPSPASFPSEVVEASELRDTSEPPPTPPSDLWNRAFREANDETQKWIRKHKLDYEGLSQPVDHIEELIGLVENETISEKSDMPLKIEIGNQKIVVREYIADAVAFITMVGDAAITFAPPQASAPWAVAKAVLKIPVKQIEQKAVLLGTIQWFTRIVRRGQIFEDLYKTGTTDERAVKILHDALFDVYKAALELLAISDTLLDSGTVRQTWEAILRPDSASGKVKNLFEKEQKLSIEVQACEGSRSAMSSDQANEGIKELNKQLTQLSSPLPRIDKSVATLLRRMDESKLEKLMHFISPEMFGKSHAAVAESRIENTGDWLLASRDFQAWQEISSSSAVLCLKGTVGTGKTYLTSKVVDHVKQTLNKCRHDEGFAFFYCIRSGPLMQDPIVVLRSFVRQLSGRAFDELDLIQSSLVQACEIAKREGRELGYKDCTDLILESLNLYSKSTIILDALDETDITTYNLCTILIEIMEKSKRPIKIFISTRPDRAYLKAFENKSVIALDANNQQTDIEMFLSEKLYSTKSFQERSGEIQAVIKDIFKTRSCGMFRWVYLQVRSLEKHFTDDAVHNWAGKLPRNLMEAYDQLWERMGEYDEPDVALAERAIQWVLCSFEPLEKDILLEAVQYAVEGSTVVQKEKPTKQQILSLCQDLLTIDEERNVWMLPHASVAEYFETKGWTSWKCDAFTSKVCLSCLETKQFEYDTFSRYVRDNWGRHVGRYDKWLGSMKEREADPDLIVALKRFLGSPSDSSASYRKFVDTFAAFDDKSMGPGDMALFAVCRDGFYYTLIDWWQEGKITEEMALRKDEVGRNSLALAVLGNSMPMLRHLIDLIDVTHPDAGRHSGALRIAVEKKNLDILKLLVEEGRADVNFSGGRSRYTTAQAAAHRNPEALRWMVDQGIVDLEREISHVKGNVLIEAAESGNIESVQILLDAGANVNAAVQNGWHGSALAAAVWRVEVETVRLLLDRGADPNLPLKGGNHGSALEASVAQIWGSFEESRLKVLHALLDAGADPTAIFDLGEHGNALAAAAFYGRQEILNAMIDRTGAERAIETLRQSRHPNKRYFQSEEDVQRWRDTATYLANEVGVDREILRSIGLDVELGFHNWSQGWNTLS